MNMDVQEKKIEYLQHCVSENLNHARHVENERLTFTSIYTAIVVGSVAVLFGLENGGVAFVVSLLLTGFGLIAVLLNGRWQEVFDNHIAKAESCDAQWRKMIGEQEKGYVFKKYSAENEQNPHEGRTKRTFALLYKGILLALAALTIYLGVRAVTGDGSSLYFSSESVEALEEFLNKILEAEK